MKITFMYDNHTFKRINALGRETRKKEILGLFAAERLGTLYAKGHTAHAHLHGGLITEEDIDQFLDRVEEIENWEAR